MSHNLWPLLSGQTDVSPRTELAVGAEHEVGGLISGTFKVVLGDNAQAGWAGQVFPNTTSDWNPSNSHEVCGNTTETGCLYNILEDPGEHVNLAAQKPKVFNRMIQRIAKINEGFFDPARGTSDPKACELALTKYGGFWGPFVGVESTSFIV